jgi:hypothetical protein
MCRLIAPLGLGLNPLFRARSRIFWFLTACGCGFALRPAEPPGRRRPWDVSFELVPQSNERPKKTKLHRR